MTTPTPPANELETMTLAEIRALLTQTAQLSAENARAIADMQQRHDKEMSEIRDAIASLAAAQHRTNQEVSTRKGWGLELYCERNPEIFAVALGPDDDVFIYARRELDHQPFCLVVETSYQVDDDAVDRAVDRAGILDMILQKYQPRHPNGRIMPIVAGADITPGASSKLPHFGVTYVSIQNGNQLTNPPE